MPVTGSTLEAALKMCCDLTGAEYAIYWVNTKGNLVVANSLVTPERNKALEAQGKVGSFADASQHLVFDLFGGGPLATAAMSSEPVFVKNACAEPDFKRKDLAREYGIESICFMAFASGVLEFGTSSTWAEMPAAPVIPERTMREAFEDYGAKYTMLWAEKGGDFTVVANYKIPERIAALKNKRGDDKSYVTESCLMKIPSSSESYIAKAARKGEPIIIQHAGEDSDFQRMELAKEFSVDGVHFVPVPGGVLEYGMPKESKLSGNTLAAALKMRCDTSGASYSIYWTEEDGEFVVAGEYVTPAYKAELEAQGKTGGFAQACQGVRVSAAGDSPVAACKRTSAPVFVPDASAEASMGRQSLATEHGVVSIAFKPTEGGVMEFGISRGSEAAWTEIPACPDLPKAEMKKAFNEQGAVYMMWWQQKAEGEPFFVTGEYEQADRARVFRNQRGNDESFSSKSHDLVFATGGDGVVASAADSGSEIMIPDATADMSFNRQELAKEFGIGEIHIVPCKDGVLEYGKALWW